jgi:large subunit ribosomal protein L6
MSRIGRKPIAIPAGVEITVAEGNVVTVKGPLGTLTRQFHPNMSIAVDGAVINVTRPNDEKLNRSLHGLSRTLLDNMVTGVTKGFSKTLEVNGVGYRVQKQGKVVTCNLGFSHPVTFEDTDEITLECPTQNQIVVKGCDKQKVGQMAAEIREKRPPEPYKGKGIKYADEVVRRKEGKTGGKKK